MENTDTLPVVREPDPYERRFGFLFPANSNIHRRSPEPRYRLHAPDAFDFKWSVWDATERRTVSRGDTPEAAVDEAIVRLRCEPFIGPADDEK